MRMFLDCEWTKFHGELMSIALVAEDGSELYAVLAYRSAPCEWVRQNVVPVLGGGSKPVSIAGAQRLLEQFFARHESVTIVADYPEDFMHLMRLVSRPEGATIKMPPITLELWPTLSSEASSVRHNALCDARALMDDYRRVSREYGHDEAAPVARRPVSILEGQERNRFWRGPDPARRERERYFL